MGSEVQWDLVLSRSQCGDFVLMKGTQNILSGSVFVPVIFGVTSLTTLPPVVEITKALQLYHQL
jgi:hypothetical protein